MALATNILWNSESLFLPLAYGDKSCPFHFICGQIHYKFNASFVQASDQVKILMAVMQQDYSLIELMQLVCLTHRPMFQKNYLNPALDAGLIERTISDKPKSPKQKYRLKPGSV